MDASASQMTAAVLFGFQDAMFHHLRELINTRPVERYAKRRLASLMKDWNNLNKVERGPTDLQNMHVDSLIALMLLYDNPRAGSDAARDPETSRLGTGVRFYDPWALAKLSRGPHAGCEALAGWSDLTGERATSTSEALRRAERLYGSYRDTGAEHAAPQVVDDTGWAIFAGDELGPLGIPPVPHIACQDPNMDRILVAHGVGLPFKKR